LSEEEAEQALAKMKQEANYEQRNIIPWETD
jgi:hypothetical protein